MLLPTSPVARLGETFMRDTYYGSMLVHDLAFAFVARVDSAPAGFIIATSQPDSFMSDELRRAPIGLAWSLGRAILTRPGRLAVLWETHRLNMSRQVVVDPVPTGEMLSFGVAEEFRRPAFVRSTGIRVGHALLEAALQHMRQTGLRRARAIVDQDNISARFFYNGAGWTLTRADVGGWAVPTCEFQLDLQ